MSDRATDVADLKRLIDPQAERMLERIRDGMLKLKEQNYHPVRLELGYGQVAVLTGWSYLTARERFEQDSKAIKVGELTVDMSAMGMPGRYEDFGPEQIYGLAVERHQVSWWFRLVGRDMSTPEKREMRVIDLG